MLIRVLNKIIVTLCCNFLIWYIVRLIVALIKIERKTTIQIKTFLHCEVSFSMVIRVM